MNKINKSQLEFLNNNCSNTIKHLLFLHLEDVKSKEFKANYNDLLKSPLVLYWKNNIPTDVSVATILGSNDACFENSFGKLLSFGLDVNDILDQSQLQKYISFLNTVRINNVHDSLARYVVAGYLYTADCSHEVVRRIVIGRIDTLYNFITKSPIKYNIYIDPANFKIQKQYKSKKLVNPVLYENNELILPLIHDVFIFSHIYNKLSRDNKKKIDVIIDYIADKKYQSLDYGYGIIKSPQNKFHFMGWSAHLPLFNEKLSSNYFKRGLLFRMVLFSKFKNKNIQLWLKKTLIKLEEFKLDEFRYRFPNNLLPEIKDSYFMNGRHTSLNESRRQKLGTTIESTYYIYLANENNRLN